MPILDARHDFAHPVEGDLAWSESYYFNAYCPVVDAGLFTRIGVRPNEGTMDVGLSVWLPERRARALRCHPRAARDDRRRSRCRRRALRASRAAAVRGGSPPTSTRARPRASAHLAHLDDLTSTRSRRVGVDGQGRKGSGASAATGAIVGKGHLEQAGRWTGWIEADGDAPRARRRARQPRQVVGPAPLGRPEDVALVLDQHRRRHPLRRASGSAPTPAICTAVGCGPTASTRASRSGRSRARSPTTA